MAAVAHLSPVRHRHARLVVVRSAPMARPVPAPVSPTTYRRRRVAAAAATAAVLLALFVGLQSLLGAFGAGSLAGSEGSGMAGSVYVVQPGDTFWDIARMLRPHGDPRPLVTRLVAAHGSPVLRVGDRIPLPAEG